MTSREVLTVGGAEARIAMLVQAYLDADYRWQQLGGWHHLRVGETAPAIDEAFPEATRFGLLSAWNPQSVVRADAENRAADEALHARLVESGVICRPAFSSAWDRSWREPSWLTVGMASAAFDALAWRFGQLGTLWWRRGEAIGLRVYTHPVALASPPDCIDWIPPSP